MVSSVLIMVMALSSVLLVIGFIILIKSASLLINGACSLAKRLSVSEIAIGLTVVAFGTSAPELIVNVISSAGGHNEICFGKRDPICTDRNDICACTFK